MIASALVTVVVAGRRIDATYSAHIDRGVVVAPLDPFVRAFAERITADEAERRVTVSRGGYRISIRLDTTTPGDARVPLAEIARALGASVAYDGRTRTLQIWIVPEPLVTMTPVAGYAPPPEPLRTFAPKETPAPAPRVTGIPQPRRTPIVLYASPPA